MCAKKQDSSHVIRYSNQYNNNNSKYMKQAHNLIMLLYYLSLLILLNILFLFVLFWMCVNVKTYEGMSVDATQIIMMDLAIENCECLLFFVSFCFVPVFISILCNNYSYMCEDFEKSSVFFQVDKSKWQTLLTTTAGTHFCDVFNVVLNFLFMSVMMLMYGVDYVEKTMEIFHKEICRKIKKRNIYKRLLRFDYIGGRNRVRKLINIMDWIGYDGGEDG